MYTVTLLSLALVAARAAAFDVAQLDSVPVVVGFKLPDGGSTIVQRDRARIAALFPRGGAGGVQKRASTELKNANAHYRINIGVGSPPETYELALDTGSGYTWVGASKKYVKTKTSHKQSQEFYVSYASGSVVGDNYKDLVTLAPGLSISNKSLGVASSTNGINGVDGLLGLAPTTPVEVLDPRPKKPIPTIMEALLAQKKIAQNVFGLSFAPANERNVVNGAISFGTTDESRYTGKLNWVGMPNQERYEMYWAFEQSIKFGNKTIQKAATGVVDTGTTLAYITPKAFKAYQDSIPGSKIDKATGLLEIPKESVGKMKSLFYVINGINYEFTPNAQLWPRSLNTEIKGKADSFYSVVASLTDFEADSGSNFINGHVFLERFYTAYDATNRRIGFATTSSTYANVN